MFDLLLKGLLHTFDLPFHLVALTGLSLFSGQQGMAGVRLVLPVFILALLISFSLADTVPSFDGTFPLLGLALLFGTLTIFHLRFYRGLLASFALINGLLIGFTASPVILPGFSLLKIVLPRLGLTLGLSLFAGLVMLFTVYLQRLWQGIGVRVLGSWVTAIALLMLALMYASLNGKI